MNKKKLGRIPGPIHNEGNEMAQAVVTHKSTVVPHRSMRKLITSEIHSETERERELRDLR